MVNRITTLIILFLLFTGCSSARYAEVHTISGWRVVYADPDTIKDACGNPLSSGCAKFRERIIYCQKWDYEICGHELHHATLGSFHR